MQNASVLTELLLVKLFTCNCRILSVFLFIENRINILDLQHCILKRQLFISNSFMTDAKPELLKEPHAVFLYFDVGLSHGDVQTGGEKLPSSRN